jgi:hypothetical protein
VDSHCRSRTGGRIGGRGLVPADALSHDPAECFIMEVMGDAGGKRTALVGATLLGVMFVGTAVLIAVAPETSQVRSAQSAEFEGGPPWWPALPRGAEGRTTATVPATSTTEITATARPCRASDLRVTGGPSQGAGGTRYTGLGFANRSSSPCTLAGFPKVSFLDRSGGALGQAMPLPIPETVTVSPGQYATTALGVASITLGNCQPITPATLRIALPSGGVLSVPAGDFAFCRGRIASVSHFSGPFAE